MLRNFQLTFFPTFHHPTDVKCSALFSSGDHANRQYLGRQNVPFNYTKLLINSIPYGKICYRFSIDGVGTKF